jgi:hypothetical protein
VGDFTGVGQFNAESRHECRNGWLRWGNYASEISRRDARCQHLLALFVNLLEGLNLHFFAF